MADDFYPNPEGRPRRTTRDSLRIIQTDAKESAVAFGKLDQFDPELRTAVFRMNGREAVLAFLLEEADRQVVELEAKVSLLLQTCSCLIDDVKELREQLTVSTEQKENTP